MIHEAYLNRQAGLRDDAIRCRALWSTVALQAMNASSREIKKLREDNRAEKAKAELATFRRWISSRDGRDVLTLAGMEYSGRAVENIIDAVWTGRAILSVDRGRDDSDRDRIN